MKQKSSFSYLKGKSVGVALGLTATCLLGFTAYEIWEKKDKLFPSFSKKNSIPLETAEKEQLAIELNHSLQKLNELKRLLFIRSKAPETTLVKELRAIIDEKEARLRQNKDLYSQSQALLLNDIEILKKEIATLRESLENTYRYAVELSDKDAIRKAFDVVFTHYQNKLEKEKILSVAVAGAEKDDELQFQKTLFALEKEGLSEKSRYSIEEIRKELAEATLQITLQQEREKLLESALTDIKTQYNDLKSRLQSSEEKVLQLSEWENSRSLFQTFMFELQVDQIKIQRLQYELEELASALKAIEKERNLLQSNFDSKIEELSFEAINRSNRVADRSQALEESHMMQTSLMTQIKGLEHTQEEEKKNARALEEELQKSEEIQKLLEIQLLAQDVELKEKEAAFRHFVEEYRDEKKHLRSKLLELEKNQFTSKDNSEHLIQLQALIAEKEALLEKNSREKDEALNKHEIECEALRKELSVEKNKCCDLVKELEKCLSDFEKVSKDLHELKIQLSAQELASLSPDEKREVIHLKKELKDQEEAAKALKDQLEEAYTEKEKALQKASFLQEELENQEIYLAKLLKADTEAKKILEDELKDLENELEASRSFLNSTHKTLEKISSDYETNEREIEKLKDLLEEKDLAHQNQLEHHQNSVRYVESETEALRLAISREEERSKKLEEELSLAEEKLDRTEQLTAQIKKQLLMAEAALQKSIEEKEVSSQKVIELHQALENRGDQSKALQESLTEVNEKYQELSFYLDEQKQSLLKLQNERDQLAEEISYLKRLDTP